MAHGKLCYTAKVGRQKRCAASSVDHSQQQGKPKILVVSDSESKLSFPSSALPPADQPLPIFATHAAMNAAQL